MKMVSGGLGLDLSCGDEHSNRRKESLRARCNIDRTSGRSP